MSRALLASEGIEPIATNQTFLDVSLSTDHSLAASYQRAVLQIEALSGKTISTILIVGGGSKDRYLNALTATVTGKTVLTGLSEATALGNILVQIMACEGLTLQQAREIVKQSFSIKETSK